MKTNYRALIILSLITFVFNIYLSAQNEISLLADNINCKILIQNDNKKIKVTINGNGKYLFLNDDFLKITTKNDTTFILLTYQQYIGEIPLPIPNGHNLNLVKKLNKKIVVNKKFEYHNLHFLIEYLEPSSSSFVVSEDYIKSVRIKEFIVHVK